MMFIDLATLKVAAGNGGAGLIAFSKQPFENRGGPCGGHGGAGGNVCVVGNHNMDDLSHIAYEKHRRAQHGASGGKENRQGKSADDLILELPLGSSVSEVLQDASQRHICSIMQHGQKALIAKGGRGGRGNRAFLTSTNQSPKIAEAGVAGEALQIRISLSIPSDGCLVGLPNSGKSSLLAQLTNAKPAISENPFSTAVPVRGSLANEQHNFMLVDLPSLDENAHKSRGLGNQFLQHLLNTKVILLVLDLEQGECALQLEMLREQIKLHSAGHASKPCIVIASKADLVSAEELKEQLASIPDHPVAVSAATGAGMPELTKALAGAFLSAAADPDTSESSASPVLKPKPVDSRERVVKEAAGRFRIVHPLAVRLAAGSNLNDPEALVQYRVKMEELKLTAAMEAAGVVPGDQVAVAQWDFSWG